MGMIFVKPREGSRVRQPERRYRVMPAEGAFVPDDAYYTRLLLTGDVAKGDPPKKATASPAAAQPAPVAAPPAEPAAPATSKAEAPHVETPSRPA